MKAELFHEPDVSFMMQVIYNKPIISGPVSYLSII